MTKKNIITIFVLAQLMFACNDNNKEASDKQTERPAEQTAAISEENTASGQATTLNSQRQANNIDSLQLAYEEIVTAIAKKDGKTINKYIDDNLGLFIIYSLGAMPEVKHIYKAGQFEHHELLNIKLPENTILNYESLPKIICDKQPYDKQGVFASDTNPLKENPVWEYTTLNEKEKQAAMFAAEKITHTIIDTHNFVYYFGKLNGSYKLLFIDIRKPCTA